VSQFLNIDENYLLDFTDLSDGLKYNHHTHDDYNDDNYQANNSNNRSDIYTSSLLRICHYTSQPPHSHHKAQTNNNNNDHSMVTSNCCITTTKLNDIASSTTTSTALNNNYQAKDNKYQENNNKGRIWFGAHTDSSLITIALCSSTPGLEIFDQLSKRWVCLESLSVDTDRYSISNNNNYECSSVNNNNISNIDSSSSKSSNINSNNMHNIKMSTNLSHNKHHYRHIRIVVFVGDLLELITKHHFRAAVHRVKQFYCHSIRHGNDEVDASAIDVVGNDDDEEEEEIETYDKCDINELIRSGSDNNCDGNDTDIHPSGSRTNVDVIDSDNKNNYNENCVIENNSRHKDFRISCPYLIRGKNCKLSVNIDDDKYNHLNNTETLRQQFFNFEGVNLKMILKLIEMKRQKCYKLNKQDVDNKEWVLSAFPVEPLPVDDDID
jgi:hypothetical protein